MIRNTFIVLFLVTIGIPAHAQWSALGELDEARITPMVAIRGDTAYILGGFSIPVSSDLATAYGVDWSGNLFSLPDLPSVRAGGYAAVLGDQLFLIGGSSRISVVGNVPGEYSLDLTSRTYREIASLPEAVELHAGAVYNDDIYILGGERSVGSLSNATPYVYRYDVGENSWHRATDLPVPLSYTSAVQHEGAIYLVGGKTGDEADAFTSRHALRGEIVSPDSILWEQLPDYPFPVSGASIGVVDGRVTVAGGYAPTGMTALSYAFNEERGEWIGTEELPAPRAFAGTASNGDLMIVAGGQDNSSILMRRSLSAVPVPLPDDRLPEEGAAILLTNEHTIDPGRLVELIRGRADADVLLFSLSGEFLGSVPETGSGAIDIERLPSGHYLLVIDGGEGVRIRRLIVLR